MRIRTSLIALVLFLLAFILGCANPLDSITDPEKKLITICKQDYGLVITTKVVGKTLWVYLPIEDNILRVDSKKEEKTKSNRFTLLFAESKFQDRTFFVEYDIVPTTKTDEGPGYNTPYTEEYSQKQQSLTSAVYRAYANTKTMKFFIVVIADIKTGIETKQILHLNDLKLVMTGMMPHDEYSKRSLFEIKGSKKIVGDKTGKHLKYKNITMPEFLAEQITQRIKFKYQQSDFAPEDSAFSETKKIVSKTLNAYGFEDFESVELKDLRTGEEYLIRKSQLLKPTE